MALQFMWRKETFALELSLENSADSYFCFWLAFLLRSVSYFFFHFWSPLSLCMVFDSVLSDVDKDLLINPSANVLFVFGRVLAGPNTGFEFGRWYDFIKLLDHQIQKKILQTDRSFVLCFKLSLDIYALF